MVASVRSRIQQGFVSACVVLGVVSAASGGLVTVQVTGEVDDSEFGSIGIGSLATGSYTYDDALVPQVAPPGTLAWYLATVDMPIMVSVAFADGSSLSTDEGMIMVHNDTVVTGTGTFDIYAVGFDLDIGEGTRTGALVGYRVGGWMVGRADPTGMAWNSLALPDPEIVLTRLPQDESLFLCYDADSQLRIIDFHITDLTVVPLPGAVVLGAIGLGCCRRLLRRKTM